MKSIFSFSVFLLLLTGSQLMAQEMIIPLNHNAALEAQAKLRNNLLRVSSFDDTLQLPFIDDFSRPGMYPFDSLWLDSGVYINNNYTNLPVTIGIATFDGLNQYGRPYQPSSGIDSVADMLTSRPLDLVVPTGDTSVWISFFYQPRGTGDVPESGDSLVLQFKDTGNVWNTVWAVDGRSDTVFQRVNIRIDDPIYLFRGFQFRFYNIATVNGNRDHWNLDYVTLLKNTVSNAQIVDNALIHPQYSLLTEYQAMPYNHYKALSNPLSMMKTSIEDTIYNIDYGSTTYTPAGEISQDGVVLFSNATLASAPVPQSFIPYSIALNNFVYPALPSDSADFLVKSFYNQTGVQSNAYNDTSYYYQHFHNYYAYDDGSAEVAYAISGSHDVALAYQFDVKIQDTLRGVQIYFNPTGTNITNKLFQLTAWTDINVSTNTAAELYRMINQKPDSFDGINAFKTYLFDSTLVVGPGPLWVGFIQNEPQTLYGVGFDRNTDSHEKIFFRLAGSWAQSSIQGSLMIRPLFGRRISLVGIDEVTAPFSFGLWPNPSGDLVHIRPPGEGRYEFALYDCLGSLLKREQFFDEASIDVHDMSAGIYLVKLTDKSGNSSVQKLIVK